MTNIEYRLVEMPPTVQTHRAPRVRAHTQHGSSTISGYAAVFNATATIANVFHEKIAPGAFTDAIKHEDVRALFNHNHDWLLGRTSAGTLRLSEDSRGLRYEIAANSEDPLAASIVARIRRGDIDGSSFAFTVLPEDEQWSYGRGATKPLRTIYRVDRLVDVSPVTFPAYAATVAVVA